MKLTGFKPRFSLKWLLLTVTLLSVALFVFAIYPTDRASRFAAQLNAGAIIANDVLKFPKLGHLSDEVPRTKVVKAKLLPATWRDFFGIRRRVEVVETSRASVMKLRGQPANFQQTCQIAVTPTSYWLITTQYEAFPEGQVAVPSSATPLAPSESGKL